MTLNKSKEINAPPPCVCRTIATLLLPSTLKTVTAFFSKMSENTHQTTWYHIPEDSEVPNHGCMRKQRRITEEMRKEVSLLNNISSRGR
jgi:hypothetical protein